MEFQLDTLLPLQLHPLCRHSSNGHRGAHLSQSMSSKHLTRNGGNEGKNYLIWVHLLVQPMQNTRNVTSFDFSYKIQIQIQIPELEKSNVPTHLK